MKYLVTVKLPKNPAHDPRNKKAGPCPVSGRYCSDTTGEHHTLLWDGSREEVDVAFGKYHITRVELV